MLEPLRLQSLFEDHFQGQLQALAAHPIANFPLQRLLDAITTRELVSWERGWICSCIPLFLLLFVHWALFYCVPAPVSLVVCWPFPLKGYSWGLLRA